MEVEVDDIINSKSIIPSHIYSGRHNNIESIVLSKCTVLFNKLMMTQYDEKTKIKKLKD